LLDIILRWVAFSELWLLILLTWEATRSPWLVLFAHFVFLVVCKYSRARVYPWIFSIAENQNNWKDKLCWVHKIKKKSTTTLLACVYAPDLQSNSTSFWQSIKLVSIQAISRIIQQALKNLDFFYIWKWLNVKRFEYRYIFLFQQTHRTSNTRFFYTINS
jgi:hypothetical protein